MLSGEQRAFLYVHIQFGDLLSEKATRQQLMQMVKPGSQEALLVGWAA